MEWGRTVDYGEPWNTSPRQSVADIRPGRYYRSGTENPAPRMLQRSGLDCIGSYSYLAVVARLTCSRIAAFRVSLAKLSAVAPWFSRTVRSGFKARIMRTALVLFSRIAAINGV